MMVATRSSSLSQPGETASLDVTRIYTWEFIDAEFSSIITLIHLRLSSGEVEPVEAASIFLTLLSAHVERFEQMPQTSNAANTILHRSRTRGKPSDSY